MIYKEVVTSGALSSVGYDDETNTLSVVFKDKSVYFYQGVPKEKYEGLLKTGGDFFNKEIRSEHPCFKLEEVELLPAGTNDALSKALMGAP